MSWRFQLQAVLSMCLFTCLASATLAQEQSPSDDVVYSLHGIVVNGVTGKPIDRALVYSMDQRLATMTNGEGKFAISVRVPQKNSNGTPIDTGRVVQLYMGARKPGYLTNNGGKEIGLNDTISSTDYELKLMPGASIEGHISADGPMPRQGIQVILLYRLAYEGELSWRPRGSQITDRQGAYRFSGLSPGEYTVEIAGWGDNNDLPPLPGKPTQQFQPTYFGDSSDLESVSKIHLHYGNTVQADLHARRVTCYPVILPVSGAAGGLQIRVVGKDQFGAPRFTYHADEAAFEGYVPNGSYNLLLTNGPQSSSAEFTVHVDGGPVRTAPLALAPNAAMTAHVETQFTKINPQSTSVTQNGGTQSGIPPQQRSPLVQISFSSAENIGNFGSTLQEGEFPLNALNPGQYKLDIHVLRGYVASATSGSTDLLQSPLLITSGGRRDPIEIVLRDDTATISGTVNTGGMELSASIAVAFIPLDATARFTQIYAPADAKTFRARLAPGTYKILAFAYEPSRIVPIAYRDAATLRRLEGKGVTVSVNPDETKQIEVPLLDSSILEDN